MISSYEVFLSSRPCNIHTFSEFHIKIYLGMPIYRAPQFAQIRSLIGLMSRMLTHPGSVQLSRLDHIRRLLGGNRIPALQQFPVFAAVDKKMDEDAVPLMTPENVLAIVQSAGVGASGGLNWSTNRVLVNTAATQAEASLRTELESHSLAELKEMVRIKELPTPMTWVRMPFGLVASVEHGGMNVSTMFDFKTAAQQALAEAVEEEKLREGKALETGEGEPVEPSKKRKRAEKRVSKYENMSDKKINEAFNEALRSIKKIKPNDYLAIGKNPTNAEYQVPVKEIQLNAREVTDVDKDHAHRSAQHVAYVSTLTPWNSVDQKNRPFFKHDVAANKKPYIDMLVSKNLQEKQEQLKGKGFDVGNSRSSLHDQGFATLYKLMAGQAVECPLCMEPAFRPTGAL